MVEDFFEGFESAVVHVGGGEGEVTEAGGGEFLAIGVGEAVVVEAEIGEEGAAVAVETVGAVELAAGVVLGEEEFEAALFLVGELGLAALGAVELGVHGGEGEDELLDGDADVIVGDGLGSEGGLEEFGVVG